MHICCPDARIFCLSWDVYRISCETLRYTCTWYTTTCTFFCIWWDGGLVVWSLKLATSNNKKWSEMIEIPNLKIYTHYFFVYDNLKHSKKRYTYIHDAIKHTTGHVTTDPVLRQWKRNNVLWRGFRGVILFPSINIRIEVPFFFVFLGK